MPWLQVTRIFQRSIRHRTFFSCFRDIVCRILPGYPGPAAIQDFDTLSFCLSFYKMPKNIENQPSPERIKRQLDAIPEKDPGPSLQRGPWDDCDPSVPIRVYARRLGQRDGIGWHSHFRAQLILTEGPVLRVETREGTWIVPPQQAVFVPPGLAHRIGSTGHSLMLSLYLHPDLEKFLPPYCRVFETSRLLRELLHRALELERDAVRLERLRAVILDEIGALREAPLHLPLPKDARIRRITDALIATPSDNRSLSDWSRIAGASERTLARNFREDTGLTFGAWRQRLRLMKAIDWLSEGQAINRIAFELGYESPSAFIAMFRRQTGQSPRRFSKEGWRNEERPL
jgi:AraC-like DNA-binding protein